MNDKHNTFTGRLAHKAPEWIGVFVLLVLLVAFLLWPAFQNVRDSRTVADWPVAEGTITKSRLISRTDGDGRLRRTRYFEYEYQVSGASYRAQRYSLRFPSGDLSSGIERFNSGDAVSVHYHPQYPNRAVIDAESSAWWNYVVLGFVLGVGGFYLFLTLRYCFSPN